MAKFVNFILACILMVGFFVVPSNATSDGEIEEILDIVLNCQGRIMELDIYSFPLFRERARIAEETPDLCIEGSIFSQGVYMKADSKWTYDNLQERLLEVMTEEMADSLLNRNVLIINGDLYVRIRNSELSDLTYITSEHIRIVERSENVVKFSVLIEMDGIWNEYEYIVVKKTPKGWRVAYYGIGYEPNPWINDYYYSEEYLSYRAEDINDIQREFSAGNNVYEVPTHDSDCNCTVGTMYKYVNDSELHIPYCSHNNYFAPEPHIFEYQTTSLSHSRFCSACGYISASGRHTYSNIFWLCR